MRQGRPPAAHQARRSGALLRVLLLCALPVAGLGVCAQQRNAAAPLDRESITRSHFGNDAPWFRDNIPLLEIDDEAIQQTYYYRWQVYRSHLREIGEQGTHVTEFLPSVAWSRHPYEDLNDSSAFHILEGRWMRSPTDVTSMVDHLYAGAGNDRHFSEWIAAATLAWVQVTGNAAPALKHLDAMRYIYNAWDDHFDAARNLYWVEPMRDATEYTISSIDASGAGFGNQPVTDGSGFTGGFAYRPSINAYQYGNARAIAQLATMAGRPEVAADYTRRADRLQSAVETQLWNPSLQHFTDIYQRSTPTVKGGDFIRGRELVGYVPWMFELPASDRDEQAWQHALAADQLGGPHGLRTVEPSYPRYLAQYRYDQPTGHAECQWNGPSWPFQTSQALTAMSNLLHDYAHPGVSANDFVRLLRQYTAQHLRPDGVLDVQEDYDPDSGAAIVGLPRSHHYNHSTYIDVVMTGLLGIRPAAGDNFVMQPLLPDGTGSEKPIRYFALQDLAYHGHNLTILFDRDGTRYHQGAGVTVYADGRRLLRAQPLGRISVSLSHLPAKPIVPARVDLAVNVWEHAPAAQQVDLPMASASSWKTEAELYQPLDGRLWFFPEIPLGWSPMATGSGDEDWFAVDLRHPQSIGSVELAFFADGTTFAAPRSIRLQVKAQGAWKNVEMPPASAAKPIDNGITVIPLVPVQAQQLRVLLPREAGRQVRLIALRVFAPAAVP